jgi:hypothetical protein
LFIANAIINIVNFVAVIYTVVTNIQDEMDADVNFKISSSHILDLTTGSIALVIGAYQPVLWFFSAVYNCLNLHPRAA